MMKKIIKRPNCLNKHVQDHVKNLQIKQKPSAINKKILNDQIKVMILIRIRKLKINLINLNIIVIIENRHGLILKKVNTPHQRQILSHNRPQIIKKMLIIAQMKSNKVEFMMV